MEPQDRRTFIRTVSTLGVVGLFSLTGIGCGKQDPVSPDYSGLSGTVDVNLDDHPALLQEGTAISVGGTNLGRPLIITHTTDGYYALDSFCTHAGCTVQAGSTLNCPCHGSQFSLTGSVRQGPATQKLKSFQITQEGNLLTVTLG